MRSIKQFAVSLWQLARPKAKSQLLSAENQSGQILLSALTISLLVLLLSVGVISFAAVSYRLVKRSQLQSQALSIAEAGIEHTIRELNLDGNYSGETDTSFGNGVFTITVTGAGSNRTIESTGSVPNSSSPLAERTIRVQASIGSETVQFFYGVQVDEGGLTMGNSSDIEGNVYTNGNVTGENGATISGDATVAGGASAALDQSQEVTTDTQEVGRTTTQADVAQSFIPAQTNTLTKVGVYLARVGNPSNLPLRIVSDDDNEPSRNQLANVTIQAASVGVTASWIEVSFSSPPSLNAGTRYWIILDGSANASNYYLWSKDPADSYTSGKPMYSDNWNTGNPSWTNLTGDQAFRTYMGGVPTRIENVDVNGTARANTLKDIVVGGDAYFQTLINTTVNGAQFPGSPDSPRADLPISDGVIQDWKNDAAVGGTYTGTYTVPQNQTLSLGPKKITGDLVIENGATLIVTGTLHVQGNLVLDGQNGAIRLDPGYGANSGLVVTDGWIHVSNNLDAIGSGTPGSYIMLITTADHTAGPFTHHNAAVDLHNRMTGTILYAGKGKVFLHQNVNVKEVTAWGLEVENNAVVQYESGLQNSTFTSGPGAGWSVVARTWQEIK